MASTLVRGLAILQAFRPEDDGLSNGELSRRTGFPKATVSRLSYTLMQLGYLVQDETRGVFKLGPGLLSLAHAYLARMDVRAIARSFMEKLARTPGVTVTLAARDQLSLTTIEAVMANTPIHLRASVGARAPIALTALGHAYLAGLSDTGRAAILSELKKQCGNQWASVSRLIRRNIEAVQENGYCIAMGEWKAQVNGVAVPIRTGDGQEVFAMSCGGPAQLLPEPALKTLGSNLAAAKREIETAMGVP